MGYLFLELRLSWGLDDIVARRLGSWAARQQRVTTTSPPSHRTAAAMQPVIRLITCSSIAWEVSLPNSSDSTVACFPFRVWQGRSSQG
jgi:hypothetical protein